MASLPKSVHHRKYAAVHPMAKFHLWLGVGMLITVNIVPTAQTDTSIITHFSMSVGRNEEAD